MSLSSRRDVTLEPGRSSAASGPSPSARRLSALRLSVPVRGLAAGGAAVLARPAALCFVLSLLFGTFLVLVNPPLRGPDEKAHFLRAWGLAQGELVPADEVDGRLGIRLPAAIHDDFAFFQHAHHRFRGGGVTYFTFFSRYLEPSTDESMPVPDEGDRPPVFVLYEGSEGYAPVAYLPHVLVAWVADAAGLSFVPMLYLMRMAGLLVMSAVLAYAIAVTPVLKWAFFLIAMLPSALYGRAVVGADGGMLAYTMVAIALCLAAAMPGGDVRRPVARAVWMALAVLAKPPQLVFLLFEAVRTPLRELPRRWRSAAVVVLPGLVLGLLWALLGSGRMSKWRIIESTGLPAREFDAGWKLGFMAEHPLHFPAMLAASLHETGGALWRQLVGVHGWLDTPMQAWVYPAITLLLLAVPFERLAVDRAARARIGAVALAVALAYAVGVYLIFFLVWTPTTAGVIWGVQGRYFLVILPALALAVATLVRHPLPECVRAAAAIVGATIGGAATLEAVFRVNWLGG